MCWRHSGYTAITDRRTAQERKNIGIEGTNENTLQRCNKKITPENNTYNFMIVKEVFEVIIFLSTQLIPLPITVIIIIIIIITVIIGATGTI
jgi:hypothetical protein